MYCFTLPSTCEVFHRGSDSPSLCFIVSLYQVIDSSIRRHLFADLTLLSISLFTFEFIVLFSVALFSSTYPFWCRPHLYHSWPGAHCP